MTPAWLPAATILRAEVGSRAFGMHTETSDHDEMGVVIEPLAAAMGVRGTYEHTVTHPTAADPTAIDMTTYSLRKFARLALDGNPSTLVMFYATPLHMSAYGARLRELAPEFASQRAGARFLGYMHQQKQRLMGERGQKNVNRKELVAAHGYDTKYASHIIRLGYQGIEYMTTGALTLPMTGRAKQDCLDIRAGMWDLQQVLSFAGEIEVALRDAISTTVLPDEPDEARINQFVLDSYEATWSAAYQEKWRERR